MIQANQLRIGNRLVNSKTGRIVTVLEVLSSRILINADPKLQVTKSYTAPLSSYEGIWLTMDVLEKCGFAVKCGHDWDKIYKLKFVELCAVSGNSPQYQLKINAFTPCIVEYLHQLQNLYYALTNEELEINLK